jgi:hypothetical protein
LLNVSQPKLRGLVAALQIAKDMRDVAERYGAGLRGHYCHEQDTQYNDEIVGGSFTHWLMSFSSNPHDPEN